MISRRILPSRTAASFVLDAFLGSGTTIAAERVGRRCYGLELDPVYVDTAIRRWQALTGGNARHAASDRSFDDLADEAEAADAA
jgi:DNA modification methylase